MSADKTSNNNKLSTIFGPVDQSSQRPEASTFGPLHIGDFGHGPKVEGLGRGPKLMDFGHGPKVDESSLTASSLRGSPPDQRQQVSVLEGGALSIGLALLVAIFDQLTKQWATAALSTNPDGGPSFAQGWVTLTYTTNTGAAFGVLADRAILFVLIGLVVIAVVIAYWRFLPGKRLLLRISLGLQLGGASGNVLDRLREGHVIDFVQVHDLPVFNLADSCIVIGVLLLMSHLLLSPASGTSDRPPSRFGGSESSQPDSRQL